MNLTIILQYLSYFSAFIPLLAVIIFWYKKRFGFDTRANLIGIYILFLFCAQLTMLILAVNGIHNLYVLRIFLIIEILILSYFLLSFNLTSKYITLFLAIMLSTAILIVDLIWGIPSSGPVQSIMVEAIVITLIGMFTIFSIKIDKEYQYSFFYFTFAIIFASLNNLLGVGFIELAPELSFNIQALVNTTANLIFARGFYIIIKDNS